MSDAHDNYPRAGDVLSSDWIAARRSYEREAERRIAALEERVLELTRIV